MTQNQARIDDLAARLGTSGLRILHSGGPTSTWPVDRRIRSLLLIGHRGSDFWRHFRASDEYQDGAPHPLDRWSARVIQAAAPDMTFVSPGDGPPFPPLHALACGGALHPSPLGMLAHTEFGLWVAIRGLLLSVEPLPASAPQPAPEPAHFAACFDSCPVKAFNNTGYDAEACARYLLRDRTRACWSGCLARKACTIGSAQAYGASHAKFHMDAFTRAMRERGL